MKIIEINNHHYILLNENNKVIHNSTTELECIQYMNEFTN